MVYALDIPLDGGRLGNLVATFDTDYYASGEASDGEVPSDSVRVSYYHKSGVNHRVSSKDEAREIWTRAIAFGDCHRNRSVEEFIACHGEYFAH
tara:strand:- start:5167 stop:5448 length:282 start_codon:yes stop_codon:yes gene_type:complete